MKILVTGSDGILGWGIKKVFTDHEMVYTNRITLDVTNFDHVMSYSNQHFDAIIHCAAETNHYQAEVKPKNAYYINHTGAVHVAVLSKTIKARIVYIGTCGMFDGRKSSYYEHDYPSPLNHYGRSKWYGELCTHNENGSVIRAGWMFGGGDIDHKFVGQIYDKIKNGETIYAINDVYGTPTYSPDFASFIKTILRNEYPHGVYHYPCNSASRYDVAKEFVRLLGSPVEVVSVTYDEYHAKFPCKVPYTKCEVLGTTKCVSNTYDWKQGLADYVKECFS